MQDFSWKGIDQHGNNCKGFLLASSEQDLKEKLLDKGVALLDCKNSSDSIFNKINITFSKVQTIEIINFFQNLSVLLESGITLLQSISLVKQQTKKKNFKNVVVEIEQDVADGKTFADSIAMHELVFSPFMIFMVRAGEQTGKLDFVLNRLTSFLFVRFNLIKRLRQASLLPIITLSFSAFIIAGIFLFVVPQFETLFESVGKNLPQSTKLILKISNFLRSDYIWLWILLFFVSILTIYFLFGLPPVKKIKDKLLLKTYFFKNIILNFDIICFLSVLSLSLKSGIPLNDALVNAEQVSKNFIFKQKVKQLLDCVKDGESFTKSLQKVGLNFFPQSLIVAVSIGEQSGNLDLMLEKQLIFFTKELDADLQVITTFIQPAFMIFVGILIALLMLSVYLPIFDMANLF